MYNPYEHLEAIVILSKTRTRFRGMAACVLHQTHRLGIGKAAEEIADVILISQSKVATACEFGSR